MGVSQNGREGMRQKGGERERKERMGRRKGAQILILTSEHFKTRIDLNMHLSYREIHISRYEGEVQ